MLIVPYLRSNAPPQSLLVIGLAAGTIAKQYAAVYPGIKMEGVEIDPAIVDVGQKLFAMDEPNLNVFIDDGRAFLRRTNTTYDVIAVDAYRQPYIPFHLATVEFYQELAPHLSPRGVVVVNAARTPNDDRLVTALSATMRHVFPTVILIEYPGEANTLIVASPQPDSLDRFRSRLAALRDPLLHYVSDIALKNMRVADAREPVFTDDRAPIENLIHSIIFDATIGANNK
jgi:spermidine synthase